MDFHSIESLIHSAVEAFNAGRFIESQNECRRILEQQPNHADANHLLAVLALRDGRPEEALDLIQRAIRFNLASAEFYNTLGNVMITLDRREEAIEAFRRAAALKPGYVLALSNLGAALKAGGQIQEAVAAYREALVANPHYDPAHWNLGLLLLLLGDFQNGWAEYAHRCHIPELDITRRGLAQPKWDGGDLTGKSILLYADQGCGDAIQYLRYLPMIAQRGGKVILDIQPELHRLLHDLDETVTLAKPNQPLPPFDVHCPLTLLTPALGVTIQTIPASVPYLSSPPGLADRWRKRMPPEPLLRIGLAWAGDPRHVNDRHRSISLSAFAALAQVPDVMFVSLQKGAGAAQAASPPARLALHDWTGELNDFADTASLIDNLDLVISVDTAVAHVAAAMGKPVWLLVPYAPDWRWMLDRADSPWYPTVQIFRQPFPGDWASPLKNIDTALRLAINQLR
jgi:Flp pilus assembly protein TadD